MSSNFELEINSIAKFFPLYKINPQKQIAKISHRRRLIDFWSIEKGSTVLEIGCGQGDTTAVIASMVGEHGSVVAVDIADSKYGYPVTCEASSSQLLESPIGNRIQFFYNFNILENYTDLPLKHFNYVVFSYSSWYCDSGLTFSNILERVRDYSENLAFSEWCIIPEKVEQLSHFLSVLIQNQIKLFNNKYETNISSILSPDRIRQITKTSGWSISNEDFIVPNELYDGIRLEFEHLFNEDLSNMLKLNAPEWLRPLLPIEISLLETMRDKAEILPLSTFAFVAK